MNKRIALSVLKRVQVFLKSLLNELKCMRGLPVSKVNILIKKKLYL